MTAAASRSMKKITYVRVNRVMRGKTVTVSTTSTQTFLYLHVFECVVYIVQGKMAFQQLLPLKTVHLTQRNTILPLTTHIARRTRLNREQTLATKSKLSFHQMIDELFLVHG